MKGDITMEKPTLKNKDERQERIDMMQRLNHALAEGVLTLDNLQAIPPSATSSEHHQTLTRQLGSR